MFIMLKLFFTNYSVPIIPSMITMRTTAVLPLRGFSNPYANSATPYND